MGDRLRVDNIRAGRYYTDYGTSSYSDYSYIKEIGQLIWGGEGHYGYPDFPPGSAVGGDFQLRNNIVQIGSVDVGTIQGGDVYKEHHYKGNVLVNLGILGYPNFYSSDAWGATAWSKMKPDKPNMAAFNAIYELKDVPEMLRQRFLQNGLSEIGNYYLALKFGWEPLLRDVRDFVLTHMKSQDRLKQLIRDEGRPVRRRITLQDSPDEESTVQRAGTDFYPSFVGYFYGPGAWSRDTIMSNDRVWASARFRYWLPGGPRDVYWSAAMKAKIFGLYPTPKVIYDMIPWSWLVDWFSNLGDCISNLQTSVVDRLAADYAYVMREVSRTLTRTTQATFYHDKTLEPFTVTGSSTSTQASKYRVGADPFGFGTPENSLSGVQLSILGALGLSRLR